MIFHIAKGQTAGDKARYFILSGSLHESMMAEAAVDIKFLLLGMLLKLKFIPMR